MAYTPRKYPEADIKGDLPVTNEPTRTLKNGKVEAGPVDLKGTITATHAQEADATYREFDMKRRKRNRYSANNPHLNEPY